MNASGPVEFPITRTADSPALKPAPDGGGYHSGMRYLVRARVKPGEEEALLRAIEQRTLGRGSVAGAEYLRNMSEARLASDGTARWVEICYCPTPLEEERPYWEEFFDIVRVQDAHDRARCRDLNGSQSWACDECDCTERLERRLAERGRGFVAALRDCQRPAAPADEGASRG